MACDPNRPGIQNALLLYQRVDGRPELCDRVFRMKLELLLKHLKTEKPFGEITLFLSAIEFQERGLMLANITIFLDVTTAKYETISIEIVGTLMVICLVYICIRHTDFYFSVMIFLILRIRRVNATHCTIRTNVKAWSIDGRSNGSGYTRESLPMSASFPFSAKKIQNNESTSE